MKLRERESKFDAEEGVEGGLTCCGLAYCTNRQRRIFFLTLSTPFILLTTLFLVILFKALTVGEKFQLEKLSDGEIEFINPDLETKLGRQSSGRVSFTIFVLHLQPGLGLSGSQ